LPLDFAASISGLEAVPPEAFVEADFLAVLPAEELAAGVGFAIGVELAAGSEATGAVAAAEDFWLLVFAAGAGDVLAPAVDAAGAAPSALADFLLLLLFFAVVVSEVPAALAGAADSVVESALADFLLLLLFFFAVAVSDDPAALVEAEVWSASALPEDFFLWLDFDLLVLAEASAALVSELVVASDFALFFDFLLDDFVSLAAAD
jgi:hypothetical protein